ncbi:MAG TPA: alpha/beta hydrolase-fold protein [Kofleriaceae bacterium]
MKHAVLAVVVAACSSPSAPSLALPGMDAGAIDASMPGGDAPTGGSADALVRVHYPLGSHAITIRGGAAGLSWTAGVPMTAAGTDTVEFALPGLGSAVEWKPLLDDATWALGPNYHVSPGQTLDIYPHFTSTAGQVTTLIADFHSTVLNDDRAIYVYLPASYAENTDATYPVVYMHDGQNLWAAMPQIAFAGTWNVDTAFDTATGVGACSSGGVVGWGAQPLGGTAATCNGDADCASGDCRTFPEAIVIGIANTTDRIYEYTPTTDPTTPGGGGADQYLSMIVSELKPAIDMQLRTRPDVASTAMAGSSLGGLVTAYAGTTHADVFGRLAELSPSTWWNSDVILGDVAATPSAPRPLAVYVDSGQGSADDEADTDMLSTTYTNLGYVDGTNFRHVVQDGAQHDETYWAERFPGAMQLVLGPRD